MYFPLIPFVTGAVTGAVLTYLGVKKPEFFKRSKPKNAEESTAEPIVELTDKQPEDNSDSVVSKSA